MLEKSIETKIKDYLNSMGFYVLKLHASPFMPKGIPDIITCQDGNFLAIEVKRTNAKNTQRKAQKVNQKMIEKAKGVYLLVDTLEEVVEYVEKQREIL